MKYIIALLLLATGALPSFAGDEVLIIVNKYHLDVASVSAKPGKVLDFKRVPPGTIRQFTLQMPDGVCETTLSSIFPDGQFRRDKFDVCGGVKITVGNARF
jgi:hypothetical protein